MPLSASRSPYSLQVWFREAYRSPADLTVESAPAPQSRPSNRRPQAAALAERTTKTPATRAPTGVAPEVRRPQPARRREGDGGLGGTSEAKRSARGCAARDAYQRLRAAHLMPCKAPWGSHRPPGLVAGTDRTPPDRRACGRSLHTPGNGRRFMPGGCVASIHRRPRSADLGQPANDTEGKPRTSGTPSLPLPTLPGTRRTDSG